MVNCLSIFFSKKFLAIDRMLFDNSSENNFLYNYYYSINPFATESSFNNKKSKLFKNILV